MKTPRKPKPEVSLLDELSAPLRDFVVDYKAHGADTLKKVREQNPEKYIELSTKLIGLIAALKTESDGFHNAENMEEIGAKLLQSIGFADPDERSIQEAIALNDEFILKLQQIHQCAQASEGDMN
jgi:hypothetical protein